MRNRNFLIVIFALAVYLPGTCSIVFGAESDGRKTGWSLGAVPALGYSSDTGFAYGALLQAYNYGDGDLYPEYLMTIQPTWTSSTKGNHLFELFLDSKHLLPADIRITATGGYYLDHALPFYGFGGFEQLYVPGYADPDHANFTTEGYYGIKREMSRLNLDFQQAVLFDGFRWIAGFSVADITTATVDFDALGLESDETLFDKLVDSGEIPAGEAEGGLVSYVKGGLVYDTRDNEANPMSGSWIEAIFASTSLLPGNDFDYTQGSVTSRQYFTLIPKDMSIATRISAQWTISGHVPFFMQPFLQSSYVMQEGLGGAKTLRGILMNRIVGENLAYGNMELRWKLYRFSAGGNDFYMALNLFYDGGMILAPADDAMHSAVGLGARLAMNENFIIAIDFGSALDEQDGESGLYIGMGYLY